MRKSLGIAREFAPENAKQFVKNGLGQKQLVFLCDDSLPAAAVRLTRGDITCGPAERRRSRRAI